MVGGMAGRGGGGGGGSGGWVTHVHRSPKTRRVLRVRPDRRVGAPQHDEGAVRGARHAQPPGGGAAAALPEWVHVDFQALREGVRAYSVGGGGGAGAGAGAGAASFRIFFLAIVVLERVPPYIFLCRQR